MNPTLLIGLDGATFTILDPLMENGTMPFLKEFVSAGVKAELMSTANPLTPPAWISLMTGRNPGDHGVFDFIWAEEREKDYYFTLHNFRDIRCETIWSIVSRQGGRVCSLNFPMMSPPPKVSGVIVPGLVSWKHLRLNVHPKEIYTDIKAIPGFDAKELAWDFDLEKKASKGVEKEDYEKWVEFHIRRERQWFNVVRHLMKNDPCKLTAVLFDGPDKIMHMGYRFLDPKLFPDNPTDWDRKIQKLAFQYFSELDSFLEELVELAGPDARTFMVSDHGFGPSWEVLRVNTWLHTKGYLKWKDTDNLDEKGKESVQKLIDRHFVYLDWDKTTAYARTTTSNGIYIRVAKEKGQSGVPKEEYNAFRSRLIEDLEGIVDPKTGERIVKKIMTREEAYPGENNEQAPDLTLVMRDHSFISILNKEPIICPRPAIDGTHYPEGICIARGPGIRKGVVEPQLSMVDIAPSILYSLGLPIPADFAGQVAEGFYEPEFLAQNHCIEGEPTLPPESFDEHGKHTMEKSEETQIMKQLEALGYME